MLNESNWLLNSGAPLLHRFFTLLDSLDSLVPLLPSSLAPNVKLDDHPLLVAGA